MNQQIQNNQDVLLLNSSAVLINNSGNNQLNSVIIIAAGIVGSTICILVFIGVCFQCRKHQQVVLQEDQEPQESNPILDKEYQSQSKFPLNSLNIKNPNSDITQDEKLLYQSNIIENFKSEMINQNEKQNLNEVFTNEQNYQPFKQNNILAAQDNQKGQHNQSDYKFTKNDMNSDSDVNYSDHQSKDKIHQIKIKKEKQKEIYKKVKKWKQSEDKEQLNRKKGISEDDSTHILKTLPSSLKLQSKLQSINEETSEDIMSQMKINESCKNSIQYLNSEQGGVKMDETNLIQENTTDKTISQQKSKINPLNDNPYQDENTIYIQPQKDILLMTLQVQDQKQKSNNEDKETANYNDQEELDPFNQKYQTIDKSSIETSQSRKKEVYTILEFQRKSDLIDNQNNQIKNIVEQSLASMQKVEGLFRQVEEDLQSPIKQSNAKKNKLNSDESSESDEYIKNLINQKKQIQMQMEESQTAFNQRNSINSQLLDKSQNFDDYDTYGLKNQQIDKNQNENKNEEQFQLKDNQSIQLKAQKKKKKKKVANKYIQDNSSHEVQNSEKQILEQPIQFINQTNNSQQDRNQKYNNFDKPVKQYEQQISPINQQANEKQQVVQENSNLDKSIESEKNKNNKISLQKLITPNIVELNEIINSNKKQIEKGSSLILKSLRDKQTRQLKKQQSKESIKSKSDNSHIFPQILNKSTSSLKTFKNMNSQKYEQKQYNETSQYFNKQINKQNNFPLIDSSIHQSNQSIDFKSLYQINQTQQDQYDQYYNKLTKNNSINNIEQNSIRVTSRYSQIQKNLDESSQKSNSQNNSYQDFRKPKILDPFKKVRYPEFNDDASKSNYTDEAQQISPNNKKKSNEKQSKSILKNKFSVRESNSLNNSVQIEDKQMNIYDFNENKYTYLQEKRASTQIEKQTPSFAQNQNINLQKFNKDNQNINIKISQQRSIFATEKKNRQNYILPHQLSDEKKSRDDKSLNFYQNSKNYQSSLGSYQIHKDGSSQGNNKTVEKEQQWDIGNQEIIAFHQAQNKTLNNFKKNPSQNLLVNNIISRQSLKVQNQIINNSKENNQGILKKDGNEIEQQGGVQKKLKKLNKKDAVLNSMQVMNNQFNVTSYDKERKNKNVKKINIAKFGNLIQNSGIVEKVINEMDKI